MVYVELTNEVVLPIKKKEVHIVIEPEYHYDFFIIIEYLYRNITMKFNVTDHATELHAPKGNTEGMICEVLNEILKSQTTIEHQKRICLNQYSLYLLKQALEKEKMNLEFIVEELESTSYSKQSFLVLCNILSKVNKRLNEPELNEELIEFLQLTNENKWMLFWTMKKMKYNETKNVVLI